MKISHWWFKKLCILGNIVWGFTVYRYTVFVKSIILWSCFGRFSQGSELGSQSLSQILGLRSIYQISILDVFKIFWDWDPKDFFGLCGIRFNFWDWDWDSFFLNLGLGFGLGFLCRPLGLTAIVKAREQDYFFKNFIQSPLVNQKFFLGISSEP